MDFLKEVKYSKGFFIPLHCDSEIYGGNRRNNGFIGWNGGMNSKGKDCVRDVES